MCACACACTCMYMHATDLGLHVVGTNYCLLHSHRAKQPTSADELGEGGFGGG